MSCTYGSTGPWLSNFGAVLFNPSYHGNADTRKKLGLLHSFHALLLIRSIILK